MAGEKRGYKTWELYTCLALNRLAQELDIDIYQQDIDGVLDRVFSGGVRSVSKVEISYEIKSNHQMTNKILEKLEQDGLVSISKDEMDKRYRIAITRKGVIYLRKFNALFSEMYRGMIVDHYRYRQMPAWFQQDW